MGSDLSARNVVGYDVEALDGSIGKVDEAIFDAASGYIVVDTGPWIFGKKAEVADLLFADIESKVARGERSARTLEVYRQRFDTHVRSTLGRKQIQGLRVGDLSRFLAELRTKTHGKEKVHLSNWTVLGTLNVVSAIFEYAVRNEIATANPVAALKGEKPRQKSRTEARILEPKEVADLIDSAPEAYHTLIATAAFTALRQSELLGLRWADVDFETGTLHVRNQLSRATRRKPAEIVPLKTDAAAREIDIAPALLKALAAHSLASSHSAPEDFVFATSTGKPLYYRNVSARGLDKAADRAGLNPEGVQKLSWHDLRHTAVTRLIESGADPAQVSRFAGHSKVSTTLDLYAGAFQARQQNDSGARLAAIYNGAL